MHTCTCTCICTYIAQCACNYNVHTCTCTCTSQFLISFEAWTKLVQKWLVCVPLGIHLEPINKTLMLLVTVKSYMKLTAGLKRELYSAKEALWANVHVTCVITDLL